MFAKLLARSIRTTVKSARNYSLLALILVGAGASGICSISVAEATIRQTHVAFGSHAEALAALRADVIDRLMSCESGGYSEADGIIVFDSNGKASIGPAQFQQTTVIHYKKRLHGEEVTGKEAIEIALDRERAAKLAEDIIFGTEKGLRNWFNCAKKLELAPEVALLKELTR